MKIIAVTACAGGIAHTYMAAEAIKKAARKAGDEIKVEIQGSMGIQDRFRQEDIDSADLVVFLVNIAVRDEDRFKGKNVVEMDPGKAVSDGDKALLLAKEKGGFGQK
jgi:PTS system fructose-specific IIB component/fructose-specific PTS system IIB-like component